MPTRSSAAAASSSSSAAAAAASISPPRPPSFNGFNSTTSSQGSSSSHARRPTRSTASSVPGQVQPQQQQQPMDSSFWSPGSSASSVFQLAPPHVKDEPDQLAGQFPSLRLASASEAESGTDADRYEEQPLRAYKPSAGGGGASSSSSKAAATTRGAKGGSKRAKVSEDDDDEDDGDEPESGADGGSGVKRKLSLKTRNRLKQRAHRERRALHLSTLETQVAEMATLKADLAQAQAALAHADAVGQGQRMTYEALIRDLSMRDREREGLLLAFQSEIFRLRAILGGAGGPPGSSAGGTGQDGGAAGLGKTGVEADKHSTKGESTSVGGAGSARAAGSGPSALDTSKLQPAPTDGSLGVAPPQPYPFAAMGHQPMQQPFYFFAPPPPPPAQGQPHPFGGQPVWHGPPPAFGPPPTADGKHRPNGASAPSGPHAQAGVAHQHSPYYHATPPGEGGMPYNLFPPHLRPAATGHSPKASPENSGLAPPVNAEASSSSSAASPALSQQSFGDDASAGGGGRRSSTSPACQAVGSPPVPPSSKLLSKLPQLQTQFQPPSPLPIPPRGVLAKEAGAGVVDDDDRTPAGGKEPLDSLVPMMTSPSILTPTAAAPHHGLYPSASGPLPSPFSAFGPYGYSAASGGVSGHSWSFTATTPTNGMGSALWGGLGLPGGQTWPWMGMGGGVSPVATSPAWAAWGQPPSGRPSSSGNDEGSAA